MGVKYYTGFLGKEYTEEGRNAGTFNTTKSPEGPAKPIQQKDVVLGVVKQSYQEAMEMELTRFKEACMGSKDVSHAPPALQNLTVKAFLESQDMTAFTADLEDTGTIPSSLYEDVKGNLLAMQKDLQVRASALEAIHRELKTRTPEAPAASTEEAPTPTEAPKPPR